MTRYLEAIPNMSKPTRKPVRVADTAAKPQQQRRKRTTRILLVVPTTIKAVAAQTGISAATIGARYHRIQDAFPGRVVTLEALTESHKTGKYRGKY